jgi:hypothetical protein
MATKNYYTIDPTYDKLFVKCDGTTTTFVDDATQVVLDKKDITAEGNATQLPIKFNKSAGFFNGTTDYVVVPDHADFTPSTGFTVETFVNFNVVTGANQGFASQYGASGNYGWYFNFSPADGKIYFGISYDGTASVFGAYVIAPTKNTWYHVVGVKNGNSVDVYVDGVKGGTTGDFTGKTAHASTYQLQIGNSGSEAQPLNGWLKELRISNVARTVAVPTAQYTSDANTVLLMHFDTPATSPLAPAIAFDGTGDYLDLANSTDWNFGTGAFTLEAWINVPNVSGTKNIFSRNGYVDYALYLADAQLDYQTDNGNYGIQNGGLIVANRWNHIALVRTSTSAGATKIYINGVNTSSGDTTSNISSSAILRIGAKSNDASNPFIGSMREIRISNIARYTTAFTPSQTSYSEFGGLTNTVLYIKGDENNGVGGTDSTDIKDSETTPKTVTCKGDAVIKYIEDYRSCIFKDETGKFPYPVGSAKVDFFAIGSGVGYFDGTGDYLSIPDSDDWHLSNGAFTTEFYARHATVADVEQGYLMQLANGGTTGWTLVWNGAGNLAFYANKTDGLISTSTYLPIVNTWMHIAVTRNGDAWKMFVNGTIIASGTNSITITDDANELKIGHGATYSGANIWQYDASTYQFNGLLDNIRISKGVARYTASFNPPEFRSFIPRAIMF